MKHQTFFEAFAELNETQAARFEALLANLQAGSHAGASTALTPYQGIFAGTFALADDAHFAFSGIGTDQQPMPAPDSEVEHYPSQEMPSPDGERGSGPDDSGHERPDDGPRGGVTIPGHIDSGADDHGDTQLEGPDGGQPQEIPLLTRGPSTGSDAINNGHVWNGHTDVDLPQPQQEVMVGHSTGDGTTPPPVQPVHLPQDTFGTAGPMVPPEGPVTMPYDVEGPGRTLPTPADTGAGDLPTPHDTFGTAGPMVPPQRPDLPVDREGPNCIMQKLDMQDPLDESPMRPGPSLVEDSRADGRPEGDPLDDSDMRPGPSLDTHNPNVEPMNPPAHGADGVHDQLNPGVHVFDQLNPAVSDSFDFSQVSAAAQEGFNDWGATFTGDAPATTLDAIVYTDNMAFDGMPVLDPHHAVDHGDFFVV